MVKSLSEFGMVPFSPGPGATQGGGQEGLIEDHAAVGDVAGRRLYPPRRRVRSLPAGINRAAGAGCKRPPARKGRVRRALPSGQFFDKERGVACSPDPGPEIHRGRSTIATGKTGIVLTGTNISTKKGGVYLVAYERGPAGVHSARESGQCRAWSGTPARPAMFVGDTPFPGRMTRSDRRGRPARPLRGGGRPDGGAPGRVPTGGRRSLASAPFGLLAVPCLCALCADWRWEFRGPAGHDAGVNAPTGRTGQRSFPLQ